MSHVHVRGARVVLPYNVIINAYQVAPVGTSSVFM